MDVSYKGARRLILQKSQDLLHREIAIQPEIMRSCRGYYQKQSGETIANYHGGLETSASWTGFELVDRGRSMNGTSSLSLEKSEINSESDSA